MNVSRKLKSKCCDNSILNYDDAKKEVKDSLENISYLLSLIDGKYHSSEVLNVNVLRLLKINYLNISKYFSEDKLN